MNRTEFISYLEHTLIPDTLDAGRSATADDLDTMLHIIKHGKLGPGESFRTVTQFVEYVRTILVPDLREAGSTGYAEDFTTGLRFIKVSKRDKNQRRHELYGRKKMKRNPMKLKQLKSNMTELKTVVPGFRGETTILFSYETPVAAYNLSPEWHDKFGGSFIKTNKKWSVTTSKHINQWLQGAKAHPVEQDILDNLTEGEMKTNPHKRTSKKPLSAAQKRARELFVQRVKSGAFKRGKTRKNPVRKFSRRKMRTSIKKTAARLGFGNQRRALHAATRTKPLRTNPFAVVVKLIGRRQKWYIKAEKPLTITDKRSEAKHFSREDHAIALVKRVMKILVKHRFTEARTERFK